MRLRGYDYSQEGAYFITIVTHGRTCLFGDIIDGQMVLNDAGREVQSVWDGISTRHHGVSTDAFIIMPNHVHGIIIIRTSGVDAGNVAVADVRFGETVGAPLVGARQTDADVPVADAADVRFGETVGAPLVGARPTDRAPSDEPVGMRGCGGHGSLRRAGTRPAPTDGDGGAKSVDASGDVVRRADVPVPAADAADVPVADAADVRFDETVGAPLVGARQPDADVPVPAADAADVPVADAADVRFGETVGAPLVGARDASAPPANPRGTRPAPTLGDVVGAFKSLTTVRYVDGVRRLGWPPFTGRVWHRNYHEHVIRDEQDLYRLREYIANNPASWALDREHVPTHGG